MRLFRAERHAGWTIALALILLVAQQGAQTHAYTHLNFSPDSFLHHSHAAPCAECSTFAPLLAAIGSAPYALAAALLDQSSVCSDPARVGQRAQLCRAYRSRAPPIQS